MNHYVLCFGVCQHRVLVHGKMHGPPGSLGLNGPGGRVRESETVEQAASREWREEVVGLPAIAEADWHRIGHTSGTDWRVDYVAAVVGAPELTLLIDGLPATFVSVKNPKRPHMFACRFVYYARRAVKCLAIV